MLTEDGKHLYVSYDEYHNLIEKLALKVFQSGWQFDTILCLARGGMRPGDILSPHLQQTAGHHVHQLLPCRRGHGAGHLDIARFITTPKGEIAGRVLLVDDLADTGHTLKAVFEMLKSNYAPITELRSAVIWTKGLPCPPSPEMRRLLGGSSCPPTPGFHQPFEATTASTVIFSPRP
jgi:hypoxanthine phosphoribosyltransferase